MLLEWDELFQALLVLFCNLDWHEILLVELSEQKMLY